MRLRPVLLANRSAVGYCVPMLSVLGNLIPYGVAMALSPLPIMAVLLLLMAPVGLRGALSFAGARLLCIAALAGGVGLLSHALDDAAGSKGPTAAVRIALGLALMVLAVVKWLRRPGPDEEPKVPGWMKAIESSTAPGALRLGVVLTLLNLKELAFASGAGLAIGAADLSPLETWASVAVFMVLSCATVLAPIGWVLSAGSKSTQGLASARGWLMSNNPVILAVILLLIGALMVGGGLSELQPSPGS